MRKIGLLVSLLSVGFCFSQIKNTALNNLNYDRLMSQAVNKIGVSGLADNEYEGSPFLDKEFLPSTIMNEKGTFLLRYNIFNDEIIMKKGEEYFKIPKEGVDYFNINNKYIIRLINGTYYIQSSSEKNNYTVVRKQEVKFISSKVAENTYDQGRSAKFSNTKPDYFLFNMETKTLIPLKAGDLKNAFPMKEADLNVFLKKNKLKDPQDYNALLEIIAK
ncbi:hypothetical protein [Chryseobacterium sp. 52]|uniref:hypothetical protein n=1 Tax=Chryseobacterium sp. 52 TaxID=2035213 RepID=UPI00117C320B|nr:hypothetical protein [Chryseobacterium sp. 52]